MTNVAKKLDNLQEKENIYNGTTVYRERGYYLKRREQFEEAKSAYDEAFKYNPDDVRNLIGRSQVCANAAKPLQAYADAKLALELEPTNMNAINVQAQALYTMSDFEHSVVTNYRGARTRRQPSYFIEGISQGVQTLQDCIGTEAGHVMLDFLPLLKKQEAHSAKETEGTKPSRESRIPTKQSKTKLPPTEHRQHMVLSRVLAMKYLGDMAYDKFFIDSLVKDRRLESANASGSEQMKSLVQGTLSSLVESQEMLRRQRPYYTIKLAENSESQHMNKFKKSVLQRERVIAIKMAEKLLDEIRHWVKNYRVKDVITTAERFQKFLDSKSLKILPDKEMYVDRLYRYVGDAYLSQHRLSYKLSGKTNRRRIAFLMGLSTDRPTSYDSVVANSPIKYADVQRVTEKVMKSLKKCDNPAMRCWLLYELARLLCSQKNYAQSKFYAKRCQREAQDLGSVAWWLNGCFVLLSGDMRQGNVTEVQCLVEEAYEWSKQTRDSDLIQAFLYECVKMAGEVPILDESKAIAQRQKQILSVMSGEERSDTEVLFRRMSALPRGRRFSVLPGNVEPKFTKPERVRDKQKGLSVVSGDDKCIIPHDANIDIPGYQTFDL